MARPGPKPKPIEEKRREGGQVRLKGTRTRRIPDPIVLGGRPAELLDPPEDLAPGEADVWRAVVPTLQRSGLVDAIDELALRNLCLVVSAIREAKRMIADEGWYVQTPNHYKIAHPAVGVLRQFLAEFRQWSDRFGLDPAARASLVGAGVKPPRDEPEDEPATPQKLRAV